MEEVFCIKSDVQEKIKEEYFSDCMFENGIKSEIDVTHASDYVKSEDTAIKYQPIETISQTVVKEERQHTQIKNEVKDEYLCDSENEDFQIATEGNEANSINTVEDIKSEEIDIKYERFESFRLFTENGETLPVASNRNCEEVTKSSDKLKRKDLSLVDGKVDICSFEMKHKNDAKKNVTVNVRCLETPVHKCNICSYKTGQKRYLRAHMLVHTFKTPNYECCTCPYKTWSKKNLKNHMLVHTDPSELEMYACATCPFKTRRKRNLRSHMLVHTDPSKRAKFECNTCPYKTWQKGHLQNHMLVHTDFSETAKYECDSCSYKTRMKNNLQRHMLVHIDPCETPKYACNTCNYKTWRKSNLQSHVLVHTESYKTQNYECNNCPYKTWRKLNMKSHMLVHRDPPYECNICQYKTRRKSYLQRHMLGHTNPSKPVKPK